MADEWYYSRSGVQYGPVPRAELERLGQSRQLYSSDYVWTEGMTDWAPAGSVPGLFQGPPPLAPRYDSSKRLAAGIIAILVGYLGIHKFALGYTGAGLTMLLVSVCTCGILGVVMWAIGIAEGIIYLSKTDEEFYHTYVAGRKDWF
jgi:TM2 domain-containing membrane protein YozV